MAETNPILVKTYAFSLAIINLCRQIQNEEKEYILTKQLIRSGTSIGADAEEAIGGSSKKDFAYKFTICYKEARESKYWLRLMRDSDLISEEEADTLINDCEEILKILFSIIRSTKD